MIYHCYYRKWVQPCALSLIYLSSFSYPSHSVPSATVFSSSVPSHVAPSTYFFSLLSILLSLHFYLYFNFISISIFLKQHRRPIHLLGKHHNNNNNNNNNNSSNSINLPHILISLTLSISNNNNNNRSKTRPLEDISGEMYLRAFSQSDVRTCPVEGSFTYVLCDG